MSRQYFTNEINLNKIEKLYDYLIHNDFHPIQSQRLNYFNRQYKFPAWRNFETETEVDLYNPKHHLIIETFTEGNEESGENVDLIKKISKIVESEKIVNGLNIEVKF
jgi:hypothetical protein